MQLEVVVVGEDEEEEELADEVLLVVGRTRHRRGGGGSQTWRQQEEVLKVVCQQEPWALPLFDSGNRRQTSLVLPEDSSDSLLSCPPAKNAEDAQAQRNTQRGDGRTATTP